MVNIWQIYFDEQTKAKCFKGANLFNNYDKETKYLENSVILELGKQGEHLKEDYFGVWSWKFNDKLYHYTKGKTDFIQTLKVDADIISFFGHLKNNNTIRQAENFHKNFSKAFKILCGEIGLDYTDKPLNTVQVLQNHFVASREVWESYLPYLELAIDCLDEHPDLQPIIYQNSGYKGGIKGERLNQIFERPYYTYHPFILERLMTAFIYKHRKSIKAKYYERN
jgi:hypothetical protein